MTLSHLVPHLSPSQLNTWIANPRQWAWQKLCKQYDPSGPAAIRGNAVESGFRMLLHGRPLDEAVRATYAEFDTNTAGVLDDKTVEERNRLALMLGQLNKLKFPELHAHQLKIEHWFDDVPVPVIGYIDFAFADGDMDLKTTKACPSKPSGPHVRQVSIYRAARKRPGRLLYVTDKKSALHEVDDDMMASALDEMALAAKSLMRFLEVMPDVDTALACLPYNPDDFRSTPFVPRGTSAGFEAVEVSPW